MTIESYDDVITYGRKLQEDGAKNVLVSMAEKGAVLLSESGQVYVGRPPKGKVINSVGAGGFYGWAGFMAGYFKSQDYLKAFEDGTMCRIGFCFFKWFGYQRGSGKATQ